MSVRGWLIAAFVGATLVLGPHFWNPMLGQLNLLLIKLGLLAFGGGFTLIPLIQQEVVTRLGWLTTREFIDGIALGQVTPGPIIITATFVGYKIAGVAGAALSTLAVFFPSFLVLVGTVPHYDRIKRLRPVDDQRRSGRLYRAPGIRTLAVRPGFPGGLEDLGDGRGGLPRPSLESGSPGDRRRGGPFIDSDFLRG